MIVKRTVLVAAVTLATVTVAVAQQPETPAQQAETPEQQAETPAQQAETAKTLTLDLQKALDIALSENPTIKVADMEIERFDYVRKEAIGSHLPQLSAGGQYTLSVVKQEMSKGLSFGADNTVSGTLDLSLPLFAPAIYSTLKLTRTQQALAVEQARSSRMELTNAVKKAFYQVLLLQKSYSVLLASEATIQQTVDNTEELYKSGLASEYDLLTAQVQLSNLQPNIISARNGIEISIQMLRMYLSIPEDVEVVITDSLDNYRADLWAMPDLAADIEENTEVRQLEYQQTLLQQQIKLTNTSRLPSLAAYGSFIVTGNDMKPIDFGSAMGDMAALYTNPATMIQNAGGYWGLAGVPSDVLWNGAVVPDSGGDTPAPATSKWWWQTPFSVGLRLSVPIFSGFTNANKVRELRNQVSQVELQKEYLRSAKRLEAQTSVNALVTARETMLANEHTVAQADKAYSISKTRFEAGAGTMLEVNQAELNTTQAKLNHSQAIYDYLAAMADYEKVIGKE
jgi:outer membrane protein TolC